MDKRTQSTLREITRNIPAGLTNIATEVVDIEEEERVLAMIKDPRMPRASKSRLKRLVDMGSFRRTETVIDQEKVKKLDEYHTEAVAKARATGRLADPAKDPFNKKRLWLQRNRQPA